MKTGWKSIIIVGATLAFLSGEVLAQPGGGPGWGPARRHAPGEGFGPWAAGPGGPVGPRSELAPWCPPGRERGGMLGLLAGRLELTDEQMTNIRDILRQARPAANAAEDAVADAKQALHEAVIDGATEQEIRDAAKALGEAISNQAALHARTLASAKAVLTEEQRKELDQIKGNVPHPRQGMRDPGFRGPLGGRRARSQSGDPGQPPAGAGPRGGALPLGRMFDRADTDRDGALTKAEIQAFQDTARGGRQSQRW